MAEKLEDRKNAANEKKEVRGQGSGNNVALGNAGKREEKTKCCGGSSGKKK